MQIKKAVFTVMMGSEDFQDAAEKLVNLGLNEMQSREIVKVAFHCCVQEQGPPPSPTLNPEP